MKKSQLVELIKEELRGQSNVKAKPTLQPSTDKNTKIVSILSELLKEIGETHPIHKKINDKLKQIATSGYEDEEDRYVGDPKKGHDLMDKVSQETIDAVVNGTYKMQEGEGDTMSLSQLVDYVKGLSPEVRLYIPTIYPGGFGKGQQTVTTVEQAVEKLTNLLDSSDHNETQFKLTEDDPTFKKFSVVETPEELARRSDMVRSMGSLD
jgi:hypothetical protein